MSPALFPFIVFAFIASITPGPSNVLIFSGALQRGFTATMPLVLGASAGSAAVVLTVGLGAGHWINDHPSLRIALAWVGAFWLSWLAWRLARYEGIVEGEALHKEIGAMEGAMLQVVNPKAWAMALAIIGLFAGQSAGPTRYVMLSLIFLCVAIPCLSAWAWAGARAGSLITKPGRLRRINAFLSMLLLFSAWGGLLETLSSSSARF